MYNTYDIYIYNTYTHIYISQCVIFQNKQKHRHVFQKGHCLSEGFLHHQPNTTPTS